MNNLLFYFLISLFTTCFVSYLMLKFVSLKCFIDIPDYRKKHTGLIPRFGGIPFTFITMIIATVAFNFDQKFLVYFMGALSIIILGLFDDVFRVSWKLKVFVQLFVGGLIFSNVYSKLPSIEMFGFILDWHPLIIGFIFMIWFMGIVNSVNLIDGMDGLAGGAFFIISIGAIYIGWLDSNTSFMLYYSILIGSLVGFLFFNGRPAKFFMGDSGSLFLGFSLAVMPMFFFDTYSYRPSTLYMTPFSLIASFFLIDTLRVFYIRILDKRNPLTPDRNHLHHHLLDSTHSYNMTLFIIYGIILISVLLSLFEWKYKFSNISFLIYMVVMWCIVLIPKIYNSFIFCISIFAKYINTVLKKIFIKRHSYPNIFMNIVFFLYFIVTLVYFFMPFSFLDYFFLLACFFIPVIWLCGYFRWSWNRRFVIKSLFFCFCVMSFMIFESSLANYTYLVGVKYVLLGVMLVSFLFFYSRHVFLYLLRFWQVEDLLLFICALFCSCIHIFHLEKPVFFPNFFVLCELAIVYLVLRVLVWRKPKQSKNQI